MPDQYQPVILLVLLLFVLWSNKDIEFPSHGCIWSSRLESVSVWRHDSLSLFEKLTIYICIWTEGPCILFTSVNNPFGLVFIVIGESSKSAKRMCEFDFHLVCFGCNFFFEYLYNLLFWMLSNSIETSLSFFLHMLVLWSFWDNKRVAFKSKRLYLKSQQPVYDVEVFALSVTFFVADQVTVKYIRTLQQARKVNNKLITCFSTFTEKVLFFYTKQKRVGSFSWALTNPKGFTVSESHETLLYIPFKVLSSPPRSYNKNPNPLCVPKDSHSFVFVDSFSNCLRLD